jgi:carbonic anhydrase
VIRLIAADEALARLRDGNARFVAGDGRHTERIGREAREQVVSGQHPFAVILGCSDSRVPVEIIFDRGLGDLFVIRVAGNIVAPSLVGSVEFAAGKLGTRLVVVLGHTGCGAIQATMETLLETAEVRSPNLGVIVDTIRPAVQDLVDAGPSDRDELVRRAVRANVRASVANLRHASPLIEGLIGDDGLRIVGAEYALETGRVDFFDGPASSSA